MPIIMTKVNFKVESKPKLLEKCEHKFGHLDKYGQLTKGRPIGSVWPLCPTSVITEKLAPPVWDRYLRACSNIS